MIESSYSIQISDRCQLTCPQKVEEIQHLMIQTLSYLLKRGHPENPLCLAQCLLVFAELRSLAPWFREQQDIFKLMWDNKIDFPPLLCELCDHY